MSINISRTPVTQPTSDKFIYTTLFLYADTQDRLTDTNSIQEIDLAAFPVAARKFIESFYGVVGGLTRLVTKSVQGRDYLNHKEFEYCHYVCVDTTSVSICTQISNRLEGSRNLFVTTSQIETNNKNTYVLTVGDPLTPRYYLSKLYPIILEPETSASSFETMSGLLRDPPKTLESTTSSIRVTSGALRLPLFSISAPLENLTPVLTVTGGELRFGLKQTTPEPDRLQTALLAPTGTLKAILLVNNMLPEQIISTATITGGSLV